jgi:hypothetical protein
MIARRIRTMRTTRRFVLHPDVHEADRKLMTRSRFFFCKAFVWTAAGAWIFWLAPIHVSGPHRAGVQIVVLLLWLIGLLWLGEWAISLAELREKHAAFILPSKGAVRERYDTLEARILQHVPEESRQLALRRLYGALQQISAITSVAHELTRETTPEERAQIEEAWSEVSKYIDGQAGTSPDVQPAAT